MGFSAGNSNKMTVAATGVTIPTLSSTTATVTTLNPTHVYGSSGTASAPAYSFNGDSNTGIYRLGNDSFGFSSSGSNKMTVNTSGVTIPTLSSITTTVTTLNPTYIRGVNGTASTPIYSFSVDPNTGMYRVGADSIGISAGGGNRMTVASTGVTISTTLDIDNTINDGNNSVGTNGQILSSTGTGVAWIDPAGGGDTDWTVSGNDMYATASGNVGIGTTTPTLFKLQLTGHIGPTTDDIYDLGDSTHRWQDLYLGPQTLHIGSTATDEGTIGYDTTNNILNFGTDSTTNGDIAFNGDDLFIDKSTGRVGIGTTTPGAKLEISSDNVTEERISGTNAQLQLSDTDDGDSYWIHNNEGRMYFLWNGGSGSTWTTDRPLTIKGANVGVGLIDPTYRLQLPNTASAAGQGRANAWTTYSDTRVKTNQQPLNYGLDDLLQLQPKQYIHNSSHWDDNGNLILDGGSQSLGFIAQELYNTIPEAVNKPQDESKELWGIDYDKLIPLTVKAIQQQNTLITTNTNEITTNNTVLDTTATSLNQLQSLTQQQFSNITQQIDDLTTQADANELATQAIPDIKTDIEDLQDSLSILTNIDTRVLALNVDKLMFVSNDNILQQSKMIEDENGEMIEEINDVTTLTLNGLLNTKKIITEELETNVLTINDNVTIEDEDGEDVNASSVGTATIPMGETEVEVVTESLKDGGRVFVTPVSDMENNSFHVEKDYDDNLFKIIIEKVSEIDMSFDWFIVN